MIPASRGSGAGVRATGTLVCVQSSRTRLMPDSNDTPGSASIAAITAFLRSIGLDVREQVLERETFLPRVSIDRGAVVFDRERLAYPGDLLHEAGHVAFTPAAERASLSAASTFDLGLDHAAIAWSYAALLHLGLEPEVLFHEGGYQGNSRAFIENFAKGRYVGVPLLDWAGLTNDPHRRGAPEPKYPKMIRWLRD